MRSKAVHTHIWMVLVLGTVRLAAAGAEVPLFEATKKGDQAAVRLLLQKHADPNVASSDGTTPLHWAAEQNDLSLVQLLIGAGAKVQTANRYGATPLYASALNGNAALIELLINANADPNTALPGGETALMTVSRNGSVEALRMLLARGANVNAAEARGQTALMWAAAEGHGAAVRTLVEAGATLEARSESGLSAFLFAVREGRAESVHALLESGANVQQMVSPRRGKREPSKDERPKDETNAQGPRRSGPASAFVGMSALHLAIANAHYDLAVALLDAGADPNDDTIGWTPLHQLILTRRPNPEAVVYPVPLTAKTDSKDLVKALLAHGSQVNAQMKKEPCGNSGITEAGDSRRVEAAGQSFAIPCFDIFGNRNNMNRIGATPLLLAAKAADAEMMQFLADNGGDPSVASVEGVTPLMAAAGVGIYKVGLSPGTNEEALEALKVALTLGGDVNTVDANGDTALHGAAVRGSNDLIQLLVDRGAKLDVVNSLGWTPLTIADGVRYTQTLVVAPESASLLRQLMAARGLAVPPPPASSTTAAKGLAAR